MLEIVGLSAARGDRVIFQELSLSLAAGECAQVVGANGCGKSTLLRVIAGLTRGLQGEVRWQGDPMPRAMRDRRIVGYLGHRNGLYAELSAREHLHFCIANDESGADLVDEMLERTKLSKVRDLPSRVVSQGQQRRLALGMLGIKSAPLWLLDEPMASLDSDGAKLVESLCARHLREGGVALIATHDPRGFPADLACRRIRFDPDTGSA